MPSPTHRRHPRPKRITEAAAASQRGRAGLVALAVAVVVAGALAVWLTRRPSALPVLGTLPAFALTERSGLPFTSQDVAGRVWVADFIFTRCPDFCPALTTRMAELQKTLPTGDDPIRFVSFSVDPDHDRPDVLRTYASNFGATDRWSFVTGARTDVVTLLRDGFKVAWADGGPPTSPITHSDRFVLVDREMRIRGYYHGTEAADVQRLARDAEALRRGPPA